MSGRKPAGYKLEELFAGVAMRAHAERVDGRFIISGTAPTTFGAEVEICRVQYLPHALAIAALPEMVSALFGAFRALEAYQARDVGRSVPAEHDEACGLLIELFTKAETYEEKR